MNFSTKNLRREGLYGVCALMMTLNVEAERLPEMPLKASLNGVEVSDMGRFIPGLGDYTLEGKAKVGRTIRIAFSGVEFEPTEDGDVRLVQKDGTVYVFQNGRFKSLSSSHPMYEEGKNVVKNPSFEIVAEDYGNGRWRPADWETWNGGMPTWGGDVGKTNVRENAAYRSDGVKSIIMHSESRYLMQELAEAVVEPGAYYCLSYDYWTSEGVGNGGSTYRLMFGTERNTGNILDLKGHTTELNGTARCHFVTSFRMPDELPRNLWFSFFRGESKVDWIDNVKLVKIMPDAQGLSGLDNATYVEGQAYAPENLALEGDDYMDMTGRLVNPSFDEGTNGWALTADGVQVKISTGEKGGVIKGGQNHLQLWKGSGGIDGRFYQEVKDLPNGKYTVRAAISSSFNGTVKLYMNDSEKSLSAGGTWAEVTGVVFDGNLELGLDLSTSGSPTIDMDDFTLSFHGADKESYMAVLTRQMKQAVADTLAMTGHTGDLPGYNNIEQYREVMKDVNLLPSDAEISEVERILSDLASAMEEWESIQIDYSRLKDAEKKLENAINASDYPDKSCFQSLINEMNGMYTGEKDVRPQIDEVLDKVDEVLAELDAYRVLVELITDFNTRMEQTQYPGQEDLKIVIEQAREVAKAPFGKDLTEVTKRLRQAWTAYYESQFTEKPIKQTVSVVDTSLDGSEKFVLRVDGKPFYMTNVQLRTDKLRGYEGWTEEAIEKAVKQAADDHFNTLSIPVFWREIEPEKDCFDWTILDRYMGWCHKYGLKMELLWFSWSSGGRVQYLWNHNGRKELRTPDYVCSLDGKSDFNMKRTEWEYSLDWKDKELMEREKYVLSKVMEHVARWDIHNGGGHTVVGVQLGNEARSHGNNMASAAEIIDYYSYVGAAVKQSEYVVWTRLNCVSWETSGRVDANEKKRVNGGTNIDFVGVDIYGADAGMIKGDMWGYLGNKGKNFRMIMEIDAKDANSPIYQMAALAGDKSFDYYNFCVVDGNALYSNNGMELVERAHIGLVRQRNKILNLANQDFALKSHGKGLYVYNYAGKSTDLEKGLDGIAYFPGTASSQAVAIRHTNEDYLLLSTSTGNFNLPASMDGWKATAGYMNENNEWVSESDVEIINRVIKFTAPACVKVSKEVTSIPFVHVESVDIRPGRGGLMVRADHMIGIYNLKGELEANVNANETYVWVSLPSGYYVVENRKIMVR